MKKNIDISLLFVCSCVDSIFFKVNGQDYYYCAMDAPMALMMLIAIIGFVIYSKIVFSIDRKKNVENKVEFYTKFDIDASLSGQCDRFASSSIFWEEKNGRVSVPAFSKCIILEYLSDNHSYAKVKFEKYPTPLIVLVCRLSRRVEQITCSLIAFEKELYVQMKLDDYYNKQGTFYRNKDGEVPIPTGARYVVLDYYDKYLRVRFEHYEKPLYIYRKS